MLIYCECTAELVYTCTVVLFGFCGYAAEWPDQYVFQCTNWVTRLFYANKQNLGFMLSHVAELKMCPKNSQVYGEGALRENHFTVVVPPSSHSSLSMTCLEMCSNSIQSYEPSFTMYLTDRFIILYVTKYYCRPS